MRHSRLVRVLRLGVPATLAAALVMVVAANYMPTGGALRLPGELGKLVIKGTKVTMRQPKMSGYTADSRPYQFTADSADQDITQPEVMALHLIQAKIEMEDKSIVNVTSNAGTYEMKTEMLTLNDHVHLISTTGYEVKMSEATVDIHKGSVHSDKPVWVKLTNGVINAKHMDVVDSGEIIRFGGGVTMNVTPTSESQANNQ